MNHCDDQPNQDHVTIVRDVTLTTRDPQLGRTIHARKVTVRVNAIGIDDGVADSKATIFMASTTNAAINFVSGAKAIVEHEVSPNSVLVAITSSPKQDGVANFEGSHLFFIGRINEVDMPKVVFGGVMGTPVREPESTDRSAVVSGSIALDRVTSSVFRELGELHFAIGEVSFEDCNHRTPVVKDSLPTISTSGSTGAKGSSRILEVVALLVQILEVSTYLHSVVGDNSAD